jgi:hypothetical protein
MMQPWARPASAAKGPSTPLVLRTNFPVRDLPLGPLHLLLEQPERWSISLNGKELPTTRDDGWFVDPCFRKIALPPGMLRKGTNELVLTADFREGLDLEAVYLLGHFGVYGIADVKPAIVRPPARLEVGDICQQGFPHYTGRIRYQIPIPPTRGKNRKIQLPAVGGAVATLGLTEGSAPVVLPFQPRQAVLPGHVREVVCEVVLTRRNLFGPLHLVPKIQNAITPASFRTSGDAYSAIPQLFPSGLLKAPLTG